jgi:hypothetical protein
MQPNKLRNCPARQLLVSFACLAFLLGVQVMSAAYSQPVFANGAGSLSRESADLNIRDPFEGGEHPRPGIQFLEVNNLGADVAKNVTFTFLIPEGTQFDYVAVSKQITCTLPPHGGTGNVVCSLGDIPPGLGVTIQVYFSIRATPGTKISTEAQVTSDTPDVNPNNNIFNREIVVAGFPSITSVRVLKEPFRIEIVTQNFAYIPILGGTIGIGCDCRQGEPTISFGTTPGAFILGGNNLKNLFPKGVPTQICLYDYFRGIPFKSTFTR